MKVGILTGGGDCPGLNAVIRAVVRKGVQEHGYEFTGFRDGWRGPLEGVSVPLGIPAVRGILPCCGTVLGSSRTNPFRERDGIRRIKDTLADLGVEALVTIGGEDTLGVAARLTDEYGVPCVGVPKTIDNDLSATDYTFGFDTAVGIATEAIDRLHTAAESHMRVLVVEVMGRHAGWIALHSGLAPGSGRRTPRSWSSPRARCRATATWCSRTSRWTPTGTSGSPGSGSGWPSRSRNAPGRRPAPPSSAMSSAAARPAPSTAGSPPSPTA